MIERIGLVLAVLLLFGVFYDQAVAYMESKFYARGYMAFLVAVGVMATLGGAAVLIGVQAAVLTLACFAASGLPMVIGSVRRYIIERERERRELLEALKDDEAEMRRLYVPPSDD